MDSKISEQLTPVELNIEQIYLDPNNPRFVDDNWRIVQDSKIDQEKRSNQSSGKNDGQIIQCRQVARKHGNKWVSSN